jgi:hypothetical protein
MNKKINDLLNAINGLYPYDDQAARQYISLIHEVIDLIRGLEANPTSMLDNAKNEAITELGNELSNRMNDSFFHAHPDRRKSEFKISKMLVGVAIGKVLSNMPPEEEP